MTAPEPDRVPGDDEVSQRTRDAEARRDFRHLLEGSSLGAPGARVMRRRAGRDDVELTEQEAADEAAEMADLDSHFDRRRRR